MGRPTPWAPALIRIYRKGAQRSSTSALSPSERSPSDLSEGGPARGMTWEAEERKKKGRAAPRGPGSLMNARERLRSLTRGSIAGGFSCACLNSSCCEPCRGGAANKSQHCSQEGRRVEGGCCPSSGSLSRGTHLYRTWREGTARIGSGVWEKPPSGSQLTYRGMGLSDPEPAVQASKEKKSKAT